MSRLKLVACLIVVLLCVGSVFASQNNGGNNGGYERCQGEALAISYCGWQEGWGYQSQTGFTGLIQGQEQCGKGGYQGEAQGALVAGTQNSCGMGYQEQGIS